MSYPAEPTERDRLLNSFRNLIRAEFPQFSYLGLYEYTIQGVNSSDNSLDLSPTDTTIPIGLLANVPIQGSLMAETSLGTVGATALVEFINADPTRPVVVSVGSPVFNGSIDASSTVTVGASAGTVNLGQATMPIARNGDTCIVYCPPGTTLVVAGVSVVPPGAVVATVMPTLPDEVTPVPLQGIIGSGSTNVFAGGTGVARVGDYVTLFFSATMFCLPGSVFTPIVGPPIPIVTLSFSNGFNGIITTGSSNVSSA